MSSVTNSASLTTRCQSCGKEIPAGSEHCRTCGHAEHTVSAKITIAVVLVLIFAGFAFTQYFVNLHRGTEAMLAKRWFHRGGEAMQANLPVLAAQDYRTALSYDQENRDYRLHLAEALLAANQLTEARSHLNSLWEAEPASGEVNLALARLYVRRGDVKDAIRYYGNAINGVWDDNPRSHRIATRFELIRYLMDHQDMARARAETLALQADGPTDEAGQLELGDLLLQVNEPEHAKDAYDAVLKANPSSAQAWIGKGTAMLALNQYSEAEHAFANAVEHDPHSDAAREKLELVREIMEIDPALRGLTVAERAQRAAEAYRQAQLRLAGCAAQQGFSLGAPLWGSDGSVKGGSAAGANAAAHTNAAALNPAPDSLQLLYTSGQQKQTASTEKALRANPDGIEPAMQFVFDVERATAPMCSTMDVADRALLTLAQKEGESVK